MGSELVLGTALVVIALVAFELGPRSAPPRAGALLARLLPGTPTRRRAATAGAPDSEGRRGADGDRGGGAPRTEDLDRAGREALASALAPLDETAARRDSKPRIVARPSSERAESMTIPFPPAPQRGERDEKRRGAAAAGGLPGFAGGAGAPEAGLSLGPALAPDAALPPLDLLDRHEATHQSIEESELFELSRVLERTLADFDVAGKVSEVHPGPVITLFEYEPAPGVKVNQILQRQDDLALSLKAQRIRIVAPTRGRRRSGSRSRIAGKRSSPSARSSSRRDSREPPRGSRSRWEGRGGRAVHHLAREDAHVLIAGATGSGKSVCINTLIMSLLMKRTPAELRFIMIDPKMLELTPYNGIPHLRMPVVTDPKKAAQALRYCVKEMERRYQTLAKQGARNIEAYNRLGLNPAEHEDPRLPYLVVVVDELADLMALLPTEIEEPIGRLAQMARAVGIHLILATQRPSWTDHRVLKANFPLSDRLPGREPYGFARDPGHETARRACLETATRCSSRRGSRSRTASTARTWSGEEIERVVAFLKAQGAPGRRRLGAGSRFGRW